MNDIQFLVLVILIAAVGVQIGRIADAIKNKPTIENHGTIYMTTKKAGDTNA